jgi:hypothetical protein
MAERRGRAISWPNPLEAQPLWRLALDYALGPFSRIFLLLTIIARRTQPTKED